MLTSKEIALMCVIGFCVDVGWVFLVTWLPQYLLETYGQYVERNIGDQQVVSGLMTALTGLAGMVGTLLGGLATDRLVVRFGPIWGRRLPGVIAGVLVAGLYLLGSACPRRVVVYRVNGRHFLVDRFLLRGDVGHLPGHWRPTRGLRAGPGEHVRSFGSAAFTWFSGSLADHKEWNTVFLLAASAMVVAAVSWLLLDPTHTIETAEQA